MTQARSTFGIGGSEAAAALGLSPYTPPIVLWQNKRAEVAGLAPPFPVIENPAIRWGVYLEEPVKRAYAERFGVEVETPPASVTHPEHPWRRATPDGLVRDADGTINRGVEIKTASHRMAHLWGEDGSDVVPEHYAVQCLWYMHVLDVYIWDLAVLIGGSDFRCYRLGRDPELEAAMIGHLDHFWHYNVLGGVEPAVDDTDEFRDYLVAKWPGTGETAEADEETSKLVWKICELRDRRDALDSDIRRRENELRATMGNATALEAATARVVFRPKLGPKRTDWEAVARGLADEFGPPAKYALEFHVEQNTTRGRPQRPLLFYPRKTS